MTVTPEDVWQILQLLIVGDVSIYYLREQGGTDALHRVFQDDRITGEWIPWRDMVDAYATLLTVLAGFIGRFLSPDRRSKGFSVGWG